MTAPLPRLLGVAAQMLKTGKPELALVPLCQAVAQQPGNARLQHDLGLANLALGRLPEAVAALRQATMLDPRYTDAHFRLGMALERSGDLPAAIMAYDRATALLPSHTEAWFRAGAAVFALGHRAEAIGCFRRAAATGPKTGFGRLGAARALLAEARDAEAERALLRLLALEPRHAMALDLLGNLLAEAGRFEEARTCFARAIAAAPLMAGSYYDLVRCGKVTEGDRDLLAPMQQAFETPGLDDAQRQRLHLALGRVADGLGDPGRAMAEFAAADTVRRRSAAFDPAGFDAQVGRLIALFAPELFARAPAFGNQDASPVLIVGMPRSGTTLVEQIVSSHPDVAAGGELDFWNERALAWHQAGQAGMGEAFLGRAAADYLAVLRAIGPHASRVTDKMPFNFLWAGLIHLALPRATILHCRRAPIDTALSIHQTLFSPRLAFPTGGAELTAYFRAYRRLTDHWRRVLPTGRFIDVDYAELTATPEPAIRRIIAECGLRWDDACLAPERNRRVVRTPSKWQARQPITARDAEGWRRYEEWLGPLRALVE